jgi:hypothetical protein
LLLLLIKYRYTIYKMAPMSDESKAKLLERLAAGRAKIKAAREAAKAEGKPDPKPRKARAKKVKSSDGALENPAAAQAANEKIAPISGAPRNAVNTVAAQPVDPTASKTTPIDVPNLPGDGKKVESKKDIVEDAEKESKPAPENGLSSTGRPEKYNDNVMIRERETGNQVIPAQYPGQKESIEKVLETNKKQNKPLAPKPVPNPEDKTVKKVPKHIPDLKATEGRAPFSYSAIRKLLYQ